MSLVDRRSFLETTAAGLAALPTASCTGSSTAEDPLGVRADFPVMQNLTFLNTAYIGPVSTVVRDAADKYAEEKLMWADSRLQLENKEMTRNAFADLFGAKPEEIALLYSTSDGENIVTDGLDLKAGDNVVVDELHFSTTFVLYQELGKQKGIELRVVPVKDGRTRVEDFEARIDSKTRLVSVAWVSNKNGFRQDLHKLAEVAHANGALLYADSVQAIGHFATNLDELGVDFLTTGSYKWLFANFGVAPFFIREEHLDRIQPDRYGHSQVVEGLPGYQFRLEETAAKFEYASLAWSAVFQLDASLKYLKKVGLSRIEEHGISLCGELREGLTKLGFKIWTPEGNLSPILSFAHGQDSDHLRQMLKEEAIDVTLREDKGSVMRVAMAMFNNQNDIQRLLKLLETMV